MVTEIETTRRMETTPQAGGQEEEEMTLRAGPAEADGRAEAVEEGEEVEVVAALTRAMETSFSTPMPLGGKWLPTS